MSTIRYLKVLFLCYSLFIVFFCFAGGTSSRLKKVCYEIEMQPLLGFSESETKWTVTYEPKREESEQDQFLIEMQKEEELNRRFPGYNGMSIHPNYTAVSCSTKPVLDFVPVDDEEGVLTFASSQVKKNTKKKKLDLSSLVSCWKLFFIKRDKSGFDDRD